MARSFCGRSWRRYHSSEGASRGTLIHGFLRHVVECGQARCECPPQRRVVSMEIRAKVSRLLRWVSSSGRRIVRCEHPLRGCGYSGYIDVVMVKEATGSIELLELKTGYRDLMRQRGRIAQEQRMTHLTQITMYARVWNAVNPESPCTAAYLYYLDETVNPCLLVYGRM